MNICLCGSQGGYPHNAFCPYPLYRATKQQEDSWQQAYDAAKLTCLIDNMRAFIHKYLDVSEEAEGIILDYARKTWEPLPNEVKYLHFIGGEGSGKSRACAVMAAICRSPIKANDFLTSTGLFAVMSQNYPCTLIVDEAEIFHAKHALSSGFDIGHRVMQSTEVEEKVVVVSFNLFGYKVIASQKRFTDNAIQARCIPIEMVRASREDVLQGSYLEFEKDVINIQKILKENMK